MTCVNSKIISTPNGARHIIFNTDDNDLEVTDCKASHRDIGCDAPGVLLTQSNIKVSITDDEFDDVDQIIAQVMEEEDEVDSDECLHLNSNVPASKPRRIYPQSSLGQVDEDSDISDGGEVAFLSKISKSY